jgi:hypothetical protein
MSVDQGKLLEILGTEGLVKIFNELPGEATDAIINTSFRKAARMIMADAESNLEGVVKTDAKHKYSIKKSLSLASDKNTKQVLVGTRKKVGGQLAHLFDAGTVSRRYITKAGTSNKNGVTKRYNVFTKAGQVHKTGAIKKSNFFANAVESTESPIAEFMRDDLTARIAKLVRKYDKLKAKAI